MKEFKTLRDYTTEIPDKKKIVPLDVSQNNPFYYFAGQQQAGNVTEQTKKIIEVLSIKLFQKFPGRKSMKLSVGNGCSSTGDTIEGHKAHSGGWRVDFNYFTFGTGLTQYVPYWKSQKRSTVKGRSMFLAEQEMIWKYPIEARGLLPIFDWERNFLFYYWVADIFPHSEILVHKNIVGRLKSEATKKYPKEWKQIEHNIRPDGTTSYNHHTHVHVDFGSMSVPNGLEIDWDKEREWLKCVI